MADVPVADDGPLGAALHQRAVCRAVLLPRNLQRRSSGGHVPRHQPAHKRPALGERPRAGALLERRPAEDAVRSGSMAEAGRERDHRLRLGRASVRHRARPHQAESGKLEAQGAARVRSVRVLERHDGPRSGLLISAEGFHADSPPWGPQKIAQVIRSSVKSAKRCCVSAGTNSTLPSPNL